MIVLAHSEFGGWVGGVTEKRAMHCNAYIIKWMNWWIDIKKTVK